MDTTIVEKIQKLLNLSETSNENEAKASLLKAQELLAKYKLNMDDVKNHTKHNSKIKTDWTDITFTKAKWKAMLAQIIADNFGCYTYFKVHRTNTIVFFGKEEDIEICKIAINYAIDCIESGANKIKKRYKQSGRTTAGVTNDYAIGFVSGMYESFLEQKGKNQEWGLVLQVDKDVTSEYNKINFSKKIDTKLVLQRNSSTYLKGKRDGKEFSMTDKIEEGTAV